MLKKFLLFFVVVSLFAPTMLWAFTETSVGSNVLTTVTPQDPKAGDIVTISLEGYGFDKNQTYYTWSKDGVNVASGMGKNTYSFQLGKLGVKTKIVGKLSSATRVLAEKTLYFEPTDIEFMWQANTYTPPFYKGKELAVAGASIKIIASPYIVNSSGQLEKESSLSFSWRQDGLSLVENSGLGKNIITVFAKPNQNQLKLELTVSTADKKSSARKSLIINLAKPEIAFYEIKPLSGVNYLKQLIGNYDLYDPELSFLAIPYFWPKDQLGNIEYLWTINGLAITNQGDPNTLTVRQPVGGAGQNEINLQIKDKQGTLSPLSNRLNIKFGNNLLKFNNVSQ